MTLASYDELIELWGADNVIHFPVGDLVDVIEFEPESLPPDGAMPLEVPDLFTVVVGDEDDDLEVFNQLLLETPGLPTTRLIVVGAVPDDSGRLFTVDAETGAVLLLDRSEMTIELVNTTFALFVEFLYRVGRATPDAVREDLETLDLGPLANRDSWWSSTLRRLSADV